MKKIISLIVVIIGILLSMSITVCADIQINDINTGWYWPTSSSIKTITSEFGRERPKISKNIHQGIDIDGSEGDPVYAARAGDVVESYSLCKGSHYYGNCSCSGGIHSDFGNYVILYHGLHNGTKIYSVYMHLQSINVGTSVKAGQQIGKMGNTGYSTGAHLHFHIAKGAYNPSHKDQTLTKNNFINTNPSQTMFLNGTFSHDRIGNDSYPYSEYGNITYIMDGVNVPPPDTEAPTISDLNVKDISGDSFTVECNLNDNVGVTRVWLNVYGPGGSKGYEVSASNGSFSHKINTSDYGGPGSYSVHIYAFDGSGNESEQAKRSDIYAYTDSEQPTISNLKATNISSNSFTIECDLNDNVGVTRVWLNVYGPGGNNGYSVSASNGSFSHVINTADYGGAGVYSVHLYAFDNAGNSSVYNLSDINAVSDIESPVISNLHTTNVNSSSFTINCNLSDNVGVTRVWLNIYGPGGSKGYEVSASNGNFSHTINTSDYGGRGIYTVHVYAFDAAGNSISSALNDINAVTDSQVPVITLIRPTNVSSSSFTIDGTMYDNVGVTRVWLNIYGPNGNNGYSIDTSNNTFSHTINTSDYGGSGYYSIHVYAWDNEGNSTSGTLSNFYVGNDYSAPIITNLNISGINDSAFTINCSANEKIVRAWVYIMGPNKTEGYAVHLYGDSFMHTIETSKYGGAGSYEVHVYVWDTAGNESSGNSTGRFIANKRYTVNFNANQGVTPLSSMIVTHGGTYGTLPIPTRTGYSFNGWFTSASGGTQITKDSIVNTTSEQTLYAQWQPLQYYFDVNGMLDNVEHENITGYGTFDFYIDDVLMGDDVSDAWCLCNYDSKYRVDDIRSNVGHAYNGSTSSFSGTILDTTKIILDFSTVQYLVTFDASQGITHSETASVTYNTTYGTLPTPTRAGYKFDGWYTSPTDGTKITSESVVQIASDHTLYARWEALTPTLSAKVTKFDAMYTINVDAENFTEPYYIIIAGYKNDKLATTKIIPYDQQNSSYTLDGDIDEIRVMVWRDFITMQPICDAEVIPSNEFIIE